MYSIQIIKQKHEHTIWHARTAAGLTVYLGKSKEEAAEEAKRLGRSFGKAPA